MTIYIQNITDSNLSYKINNKNFLFTANRISYVDENELSYQQLTDAYGSSNLILLRSPSQSQIDSAIPAYTNSSTNLSSDIETIIDQYTNGSKDQRELDSLRNIAEIQDAGIPSNEITVSGDTILPSGVNYFKSIVCDGDAGYVKYDTYGGQTVTRYITTGQEIIRKITKVYNAGTTATYLLVTY